MKSRISGQELIRTKCLLIYHILLCLCFAGIWGATHNLVQSCWRRCYIWVPAGNWERRVHSNYFSFSSRSKALNCFWLVAFWSTATVFSPFPPWAFISTGLSFYGALCSTASFSATAASARLLPDIPGFWESVASYEFHLLPFPLG